MADDILDKIPNAAKYRAQQEAAGLKAEEEHRSAIEELRRWLKKEKNNPDVYLRLARRYEKYGEYKLETAVLREGLACCPPTSSLYLRAINALESANQTEEARRVAHRAAELCPDDQLLFRLKEELLLPVFYDTLEELVSYHNQFSAGMKVLLAGLMLDTPMERRQALKAVGGHSNAVLAYQVGNLRGLQEQYGEFVHRTMAANYPHWVMPLKVPPVSPEERIRIGYISPNFCQHSDTKSFFGWLRERNREAFEVFTFHIGKRVDVFTEEFQRVSDHFYHIPGELEAVAEAMLGANLHVAVFFHAIHPMMMQLAALRLSPIQCATWSQQMTSGLPTMDYYLSGALFEPEGGQDHYCERLVCLPGLGACFDKPVVPRALLTRPRSHFGLGDDRTVYLCRQQIVKYLPQHDDALVEIARRIPTAQFIFRTPEEAIRDDVRRRLERAFAAGGLQAADYCVLCTRNLSLLDYWNLLSVSDVFLDSFNYSGCITTMEAIACGLPVVTCAGDFSRGRQSYAILTQLGMTDTIARDKEEYVEIAVRLGRDREWRAQILERMKANNSRLYSDTKCVRALEDFYRSAVRERLS